MRKLRLSLGILIFSFLAMALLQATPINGSFIYGSEVFSPDIHDWSNADVFWEMCTLGVSETGDFTNVDFNLPPRLGVFLHEGPAWVQQLAGFTTSFTITSTCITRTIDTVEAHGNGIVYMTGFEPTCGTWSTVVQGGWVGLV